jgi:hypothetical protein
MSFSRLGIVLGVKAHTYYFVGISVQRAVCVVLVVVIETTFRNSCRHRKCHVFSSLKE